MLLFAPPPQKKTKEKQKPTNQSKDKQNKKPQNNTLRKTLT